MTVTVALASSLWMVPGQIVIIGGSGSPATFAVVSKPDNYSAVLQWLAYPGDTAAGTVIASASTVSPSGLMVPITSYSTYEATGTGFNVPNATAKVTVNGADIAVTLPAIGTYILIARARLDYVAAKLLTTNRTVSLKLRDTTAGADIPPAVAGFALAVVDYNTSPQILTAGIVQLPTVVVTNATANSVIQLWASMGTQPDAGTVQVTQAEIIAIRIA